MNDELHRDSKKRRDLDFTARTEKKGVGNDSHFGYSSGVSAS